MKFQFANNQFPPLTSTGNAELFDLDKTNFYIIEFFKQGLLNTFNARWTETCNKIGLTNSNNHNVLDGYFIGSSICYPIDIALIQTNDYKFPILSVYSESGDFEQESLVHIFNSTNYVINLVFPPLSSTQMDAIYPFFDAVVDTISYYAFNGSSPNINNELFWNEAGFAWGSLNGYRKGSFIIPNTLTKFPTLQMTFTIKKRNMFVASNYSSLTGFDGYYENVNSDGYGIDIFEQIIDE